MDGNKSSDIFKFNFASKKLDLVAKMEFPRSSHGMVYLNGKIYICGGYTTSAEKRS